ncbi:MAG: hypothetical protein D6803_08445 [Anaerolineae bacterium]|nr:MAG: hypothetical protein D6803_08445 [Anaerolineae bacterium]
MHQENAKLWTVITGFVAACPSLFCCVMGIGTLAGGGTYELGSQAGQTPAWIGLPLLCLAILPWLLPFGVWRYANSRPAPPNSSAHASNKNQGYSPSQIDPYFDADIKQSDDDAGL